MSYLKEQYSEYTSQELIRRRALGDELSDEAHKAIEDIFAERRESLPARPSAPILVDEVPKRTFGLKVAGAVVLFVIGGFVASFLKSAGIGFVLLAFAACVLYWAFKASKRTHGSPEARNNALVQEERLTELMVAAGEGKGGRVKELLAFGANPNDRSLSGHTALMYAARNNHEEIVELLIAANADCAAMTTTGSTAADIARRFGHSNLAARLAVLPA